MFAGLSKLGSDSIDSTDTRIASTPKIGRLVATHSMQATARVSKRTHRPHTQIVMCYSANARTCAREQANGEHMMAADPTLPTPPRPLCPLSPSLSASPFLTHLLLLIELVRLGLMQNADANLAVLVHIRMPDASTAQAAEWRKQSRAEQRREARRRQRARCEWVEWMRQEEKTSEFVRALLLSARTSCGVGLSPRLSRRLTCRH